MEGEAKVKMGPGARKHRQGQPWTSALSLPRAWQEEAFITMVGRCSLGRRIQPT